MACGFALIIVTHNGGGEEDEEQRRRGGDQDSVWSKMDVSRGNARHAVGLGVRSRQRVKMSCLGDR